MTGRMHPDQVGTTPELVRRLLDEQFPQWADRPLTRIHHAGTDHDVHRLGHDLVVRLPIVAWATHQAEQERRWLPVLAPHLPLAVPQHRATGQPAHGYPFTWSVWDWLPGRSVDGRLGDLDADALAAFVAALHAVPTDLAPPRRPSSRGGPLAERDEEVRRAIAVLGTSSTDRARRRCGPRRWRHLAGPTTSGCTVTSCPATSSSTRGTSRPSSTGAP